MPEKRRKNIIPEAAFIRPVLIVLLVLYHAFIIHIGGWREPEGFRSIPLYGWIARLSYAFMLEAFVFLSGYLYAYQRIGRMKEGGGISLVRSKFKRLILPSILFSGLYMLIFYRYESFPATVYTLLNGAGHMWFLPMLFWCFLATYLLLKVRMDESLRLLLLTGLAVVSFVPLPFRLANAMYYLLFFYAGYLAWQHSARLRRRITPGRLTGLWTAFLAAFFLLTAARESLGEIEPNTILVRALLLGCDNVCKIIYAGLGVAALYSTALYRRSDEGAAEWVVKIGACSFGVYIIQQFILQILYYKTSLPELTGAYWLPWIGFAVTMALSMAISAGMMRTRAGRFLIG